MKQVQIFSDGACKGNPGPGGWGVVLRYNGVEKHLYGYEPDTTNNRMELIAAIEGLDALAEKCTVDITTDSQYVRNGITTWLVNWKRKNWKTADNKPVKNIDLWQRLEVSVARHEVRWHWVRGHTGHDGNEQADLLANKAIAERRSNRS